MLLGEKFCRSFCRQLRKRNKLLLALFGILMVSSTLVRESEAAVDEYMTCDRLFQSQREARVMDRIPCDMNKQSYCQHKGPSYPEEAIWRFKEENRALMKRLYGDMESASLYREMRSVNLPGGLANFPMVDNTLVFSNMEYNIRVGSGLATVQSAKEPVMSRNAGSGSSPSKKKVVIRRKVKKPLGENKKKQQSPSKPQKAQEPILQRSDDEIQESQKNPTHFSSPVEASEDQPDRKKITKIPEPSPLKSEEKAPSQPDLVKDTNKETNDGEIKEGENKKDEGTASFEEFLNEVDIAGLEELVSDFLTSANAANEDSQVETERNPEKASERIDIVNESLREEVEDEEIEEEIIEEYIEEENPIENEVDFSGPSVNACPVKEEVFAPYWANNTRNQVMALLNLYPFEQYIHMETCQYEEKQMLCRDGCRCEQQYRLHRLLAFDPNNECRGIFSDWFRFPSYCVCKCYSFMDQFVMDGNAREARRKPKITEDFGESNENKRNARVTFPSEKSNEISQFPADGKIKSGDFGNKFPRNHGRLGDLVFDNSEHFLYGSKPIHENLDNEDTPRK